jgi:hypothetical protein
VLPGLRVVDSLGQDVGAFIPGFAALRVSSTGIPVLFQVSPAGFVEYSEYRYIYESGDCTGTPYTDTYDQTQYLWTAAAVARGKAVWVSGPVRLVVSHSYEIHYSSADANPGHVDGACIAAASNVFAQLLGPAVTLDLSTLNLVPPFRIQ